jgi:hypothetical protein
MTSIPTVEVSQRDLALARQKSESAGPFIQQIEALLVRDDKSLAQASMLLTTVAEIRKEIASRFDSILRPMNAAVSAARAFKTDLDSGPAKAEMLIREKMTAYRIEEQKRLQEAEEKRRQELEAQRRALELAKQREEAAKTPQMRDRLAVKRLQVEAEVEAAALAPPPEPVRVMGSVIRKKMKVRISDRAKFISALAYGTIPLDSLPWEAVEAQLNRDFNAAPPVVGTYPGVEVYEDIGIMRRG